MQPIVAGTRLEIDTRRTAGKDAARRAKLRPGSVRLLAVSGCALFWTLAGAWFAL
jgi:hypothetical protein